MAWTKNAIVTLIETNNAAVERGILYLYGLQTADERWTRDTKWDNHRGFSKRTVTRGQRIAERILKGIPLTAEDYAAGREVCGIHWRQLVERAEWTEGARAQAAALKVHEAEFERWMRL